MYDNGTQKYPNDEACVYFNLTHSCTLLNTIQKYSTNFDSYQQLKSSTWHSGFKS